MLNEHFVRHCITKNKWINVDFYFEKDYEGGHIEIVVSAAWLHAAPMQ